ncbi:efflux RND transporter periplasmic adaptor subunit [Nocardioides carbamazepini]|uniref:efflux RND transporter periplasmic adaptor subunit n=1 Tax=Nocardioides carbamazepini TaxID=2854259 RepID=UPI00214A57CC|nr:efflux RND transporter periplasmic adaptor subunit [Nocardioides carbamazepini]MCR1782255.1 efflux RND transporter periplasmic adaptor subunit [Nocardioides carbamazepini]
MRSLIRSRRIAVPLAVVALAGTGVAAYGAAADDSVHYRTVAAARGDVAEELTLSGTITPSGTSALAFGTAGTVARVRVEQGDDVRQGQVIAVLDRASLRAAVDRARSDVAAAEAQLADDREAQTTAVDQATSADSAQDSPAKGTGDTGDKPGTSDAGSGANAEVLAQLSAQQDAVVAARSAATAALAVAADKLGAQQQACADPVATDPGPGGPATDAPTTDAAPAPAATEGMLSDACADALTAVQAAQVGASAAQDVLQKALETLGATLTGALGSVSATAGAIPSETPDATPSAGPDAASSSPSGTAGAGSGEPTRTVTAATLAEDQAAIDKAAASLASARADLRGAIVRAPADGTLVTLGVGPGDRVATGDTVGALVAPGLTTVTVEVSAAQAEELATGTAAEVTPAGATEPLAGTVGRIEHTASSSSTSAAAPTYAVEVLLDDRDLALAEGMPATVAIVVGSAEDVVVVPASAVSDGAVTVVDGTGKAKLTRVATGLVGATDIEITDGLDEGDEVVLADLDAELPGGDSQQQGPGGFGSGLSGGFGGGDGVLMGPPAGVTIRR